MVTGAVPSSQWNACSAARNRRRAMPLNWVVRRHRSRRMLNRAVLIVRPKQPYIDWAKALDDSGLVPEFEGEKTAYLIPSFEDDAEAESVLKQIFPEIFERELEGWHTDETEWPKKRTFAMFKQWFHLELHSVVEDLCAYELVEEDDV